MKKYILRILLLIMMFNLCSCNSLPSEQKAMPDSIVENQVQDQVHQTQVPQDQEAVLYDREYSVVEYDVSELFKMTISRDTWFNLREFPENYEEFSNFLKKSNCSIIAGRAYGTRKTNPCILTQFLVEKVYAGPDVPDQITVKEDFGVYSDQNNEPYIASLGYEHLPMKNDQPTLLFVVPHSTEQELYATVLLTIPLPEDHQNYDEEYLAELLDYFRGDRTAYKYPELTITETIIDGNPVPTGYGGVYWLTREISDEALLEEMNDHILLRLATDYKIKIWPFDHVQYPDGRNLSDYFIKMSYPPTYNP